MNKQGQKKFKLGEFKVVSLSDYLDTNLKENQSDFVDKEKMSEDLSSEEIYAIAVSTWWL